MQLANKHILLGVTGGIAAYKSAELIRLLQKAGATVKVVMTQAAKAFITPLTLQALSGFAVRDALFDEEAERAMSHIALAKWADLILIAPATADFLAQLTQGSADDLLSTVCLATKAKVVVCPAMNQQMWKNKATQENISRLKVRDVLILDPDEGEQACGDIGPGRMIAIEAIVEATAKCFTTGRLAGKQVVLTAGPTVEPIDPVRFISNRSSGKMGYALANAAIEAGAKVTLISGPTFLTPPEKATLIAITTGKDMYEAVHSVIDKADIFISVAAVCDYYYADKSDNKLKKTQDDLSLVLTANKDIVKSVANLVNRPFVVGFAAETEQLLAHAQAKKEQKKLDMIIANQVNEIKGFDSDENEVLVIGHKTETHLKPARKGVIARQLIELIAKAYDSGHDK